MMASPQQARIEARVSPKQKRLFERAAAIEGVTLTDFAISSMQQAAAKAIQQYARIELSERNQRAFAEALMNPPEPNEALRKAAKAYARTRQGDVIADKNKYNIGPLRDHDRAAFSCGNAPLDRYIQEQASQDVQTRAGNVFVIAAQGGDPRTILAFNTLSSRQISDSNNPLARSRRRRASMSMWA